MDQPMIPLRDHLEGIWGEREKRYCESLQRVRDSIETVRGEMHLRVLQMDEAKELAAKLLDKRMEHANNAFPRSEHERFEAEIRNTLKSLETSRDKLDGKASQSQLVVTFVLAALGAVAGLAAVIQGLMR